MARTGWDRMAAWRDERSGEDGDLWHRSIILPTMYEVLGPVRGLRVLDLACGVGMLSRKLAREGARTVVGVDRSRPTLARARARERRDPTGVRFLERDAGRLTGLADGSFDVVVANMALMDIAHADGALRESARVLVPGGRLVFSISHPCFDLDARSRWLTEREPVGDGRFRNVVYRKVSGYRVEDRQQTPWYISETRIVRTESFHRTLSTYSRYLREAGFSIQRLEEPVPLAEALEKSPQGPLIAEIPLHLVVEAVRGGSTARPRPASRRSAGSRRAVARRSGSPRRTRGTGSAGRGSTTGS